MSNALSKTGIKSRIDLKKDLNYQKFLKDNINKSKEKILEEFYQILLKTNVAAKNTEREFNAFSSDLKNTKLSKEKIKIHEDTMNNCLIQIEKVSNEIINQRNLDIKTAAIESRKDVARRAAFAKAENSPKSHAKKSIYSLWLDWQSGTKRHASGAAFCRFALETHKEIKSIKTIETWIRQWSKNK